MSDFANFHISKEQETAKFARKLAPYLKQKDVLFLEGTLGAGKTFFARNLIQQLCGQDIEVPSPTFNLLLTYDSSAGRFITTTSIVLKILKKCGNWIWKMHWRTEFA